MTACMQSATTAAARQACEVTAKAAAVAALGVTTMTDADFKLLQQDAAVGEGRELLLACMRVRTSSTGAVAMSDIARAQTPEVPFLQILGKNMSTSATTSPSMPSEATRKFDEEMSRIMKISACQTTEPEAASSGDAGARGAVVRGVRRGGRVGNRHVVHAAP